MEFYLHLKLVAAWNPSSTLLAVVPKKNWQPEQQHPMVTATFRRVFLSGLVLWLINQPPA